MTLRLTLYIDLFIFANLDLICSHDPHAVAFAIGGKMRCKYIVTCVDHMFFFINVSKAKKNQAGSFRGILSNDLTPVGGSRSLVYVHDMEVVTLILAF